MKRLIGLVLTGCVLFGLPGAAARGQGKKERNSKDSKQQILDINQATAEDFANLPGIGPELARRIIAYREKHGPFRRVEDLIAVRGMGVKKWRAIRPFITLTDKSEGGGHQRQSSQGVRFHAAGMK
jgi:competence ComEA-like helix-hairpin-helix protein